MKKVLLFTFIGIALLGGGLAIALILFEGVFNRNPLFLIISVLMIFAGMGILFFAGTRDTSSLKFKDVELSVSGNKTLKKNDEMAKAWDETNQTRDKLKVVQAAATDTGNSGG